MVGVLLALGTGFFAPSWALAQEKVYEVAEYHARLELVRDGSYRIQERITFNFQVGSFTFAERDIPLAHSDGVTPVRVQSADVEIESVDQGEEGGDWRVRWEFPARTGPTTFLLEYEIVGAVREVGETNEVFWRVVGEGWGVPLRQVEAEVVLPSSLGVAVADVIPDPAEIASVSAAGEDVIARFRPGPQPAGRAYQVRVTFPRVMEGRPVGLARADLRGLLGGILLFLATLISGIVMAVRRRGPRLEPRRHLEPGEDIPRSAVLLFRGPPGWERAFPATVFDLAGRGVITLERVDHGKGLFRTKKIHLRRVPESEEPLTAFEEALLTEIEGLENLNEFASKGRRFRSETMKSLRDQMVEEGYLEDLRSTVIPAIWIGSLSLAVGLAAAVIGAVYRPWLLVVAGLALGIGLGGLSVGTVRYRRTRRGAESLAVLEGYLEQIREDLKHQLKMAPIQAAEFLFENLPWLALDPKYHGTETHKLRRRLKKEYGELRPVPWAIDRTRGFQKATAGTSQAFAAFYPFYHVTGAAGGVAAPSAGGGAVGGAAGGGAAGGGGGGAG
jgi:hypothetical protein